MEGTRSALIVASDDYQDPGLRRLRAPAADAQALASVLRDPEIGQFEVRTLLNQPAHEVNEAVEEFFDDRRPDDLLLLHVSCHGVKDEDGQLYFATTNTKLRRLGATAVAAEFVNRRMNRSRSRRVVLLLDCCYAGAFERGMTARAGSGVGIQEQFGGRGRAVITASSAMEYAFEGDELADTQKGQPSVFTSALVEGLATGEADRDQDGLIALDELYDYVYDRVRVATPNQTPGKWTFGVQGELVIARRSQPVTTPAPLPPELQEAIGSPFAAVRAGAVQELERLLQSRHAGLALAARLTLERLTDDDSRAVAAAATAALRAQAQPAPLQPVPSQPELPRLALSATVVDFGRLVQHSQPPERSVRLSNAGGGVLNARAATEVSWLKLRQVGDELVIAMHTAAVGEHDGTVTIDSDGGSATIRVHASVNPTPPPPAEVATTPPGKAPVASEHARSASEKEAGHPGASPTPTIPVGGPGAGSVAEPTRPSAGVDHRTTPERGNRRQVVAGRLAIVGTALLIVGLFLPYVTDLPLWTVENRSRPDMWWYAVYVVITAVLALGAGIATLRPRTGRLIGPAVLLGVAAVSCWGLLHLISDRVRWQASAQLANRTEVIFAFGVGWWFELVAHLVLVIAACFAGLALADTGEVRLMRRPPQDKLAWLVIFLGAAGALALFFHDQNLWHDGDNWSPNRWYVVPSIWATVMALVVPACAAVAVPRRFGVALLGGWIGGAATLVYFNTLWHRRNLSVWQWSYPMITLGFTLVALLVVTVFFARRVPRSQSEYTT